MGVGFQVDEHPATEFGHPLMSETSKRMAWRREGKTTFGVGDEGSRSETTPLLQQVQSSQSGPGGRSDYGVLSRRKAERVLGDAVERDAIEELEQLPALLARSVLVFTIAVCLSTLLGAVSHRKRGCCLWLTPRHH